VVEKETFLVPGVRSEKDDH